MSPQTPPGVDRRLSDAPWRAGLVIAARRAPHGTRCARTNTVVQHLHSADRACQPREAPASAAKEPRNILQTCRRSYLRPTNRGLARMSVPRSQLFPARAALRRRGGRFALRSSDASFRGLRLQCRLEAEATAMCRDRARRAPDAEGAPVPRS